MNSFVHPFMSVNQRILIKFDKFLIKRLLQQQLSLADFYMKQKFRNFSVK